MSAATLNKVVVITGGSGGIGAMLGQRVAQAGGTPVLAARRQAELEAVAAQCGPQASWLVADVTDRMQVQRILDTAIERHGRVDVWVNNAGRGISRLVSQLTDDDFDTMMRVNVKSALYGMQTALSYFKTRGAGHIINISSVLGRVPMAPPRSAYSASKHALNALTTNLRMELRAQFPDIHVTSFFPGVVATDFGINALGGGIDNRRIPGGQSVEEVAEVLLQTIRSPRPEVYSRPEYHDQVAAFYAAEDVAAMEASFIPPPMRPAR